MSLGENGLGVRLGFPETPKPRYGEGSSREKVVLLPGAGRSAARAVGRHRRCSDRVPLASRPGAAGCSCQRRRGPNCVSIACSLITVRNLTVKHADNDGCNVHGDRRGVRLERVRAIANADEGIRAHETTELEVIGAEVAGNGSSAGGVVDVNQSVTSYRDCYVRDNAGAGFFFAGRGHMVVDTVIVNQTRPIAIQKGIEVIQEQVDCR